MWLGTSTQKGHLRVHFFMFSQLEGHPRGHPHSIFFFFLNQEINNFYTKALVILRLFKCGNIMYY